MEVVSVHQLLVEVDSDQCCAQIRLEGEVDVASAGQVRAAATQAIDLDAVEHLVIDCRQLGFLDSTGVKTLLDAHESFNGKVALLGPRRVVTRVLDVTGLEGMFPIATTFEEARRLLHDA